MGRLLDESPWRLGITHRSNPKPLLLSAVVLVLGAQRAPLRPLGDAPAQRGRARVGAAVLVLVIEFPSNGANGMFVITSAVGRKVQRLTRATFLASMPGQVDDALGCEMRFIEPSI
jgi:hypothetical protein